MKIIISSFADRGLIDKERIVLKVLQSTDLGDYALLRSSIDGGSATSGKKDAYWLPNLDVTEGDLIVIYSKVGADSSKSLASGRKAYFYYWGFSVALWSSESFGAVLLEAPNWVAKPASG